MPQTVEVTNPENYETGLWLNVSTVARRLGVAPDTVRTWDRRYGISPSGHTSGNHRRYTPEDVERLDRMCSLMRQGFSAAAAAAQVLDPSSPPVIEATEKTVPKTIDNFQTRGLLKAAMALDADACLERIETTLTACGVVQTWDDLLVPVLIELGSRWENTGQGVEAEHLFAEMTSRAFARLVGPIDEPANSRPVILASAAHELHTLPLHAVAAGLWELNISAHLLGARTPTDSLAITCSRIGPAAVLVWSQSRGTAEYELWEQLPNQRPTTARLAAGPGWVEELPPGVERVSTLGSALSLISAAVGVR